MSPQVSPISFLSVAQVPAMPGAIPPGSVAIPGTPSLQPGEAAPQGMAGLPPIADFARIFSRIHPAGQDGAASPLPAMEVGKGDADQGAAPVAITAGEAEDLAQGTEKSAGPAQPAADALALLAGVIAQAAQPVAAQVPGKGAGEGQAAAPASADAAMMTGLPGIANSTNAPMTDAKPAQAPVLQAQQADVFPTLTGGSAQTVVDPSLEAVAVDAPPTPNGTVTDDLAAPVLDALDIALPTPTTAQVAVQQPLQPAAILSVDAAALAPELARQSLDATLDLARDSEWLDQLARDIAQMSDGNGKLTFRLDPPSLGSLQVDVAQGADGVSMRFTTETEAARAILNDAHNRLLAEARAQGVRVAEAHVELGHSGTSFAGNGHNQGGGREPAAPNMITAGARQGDGEPVIPAPSAAERFA